MATGQEEGFVSCLEGLLSIVFDLDLFPLLGMPAFAHCICIVLCFELLCVLAACVGCTLAVGCAYSLLFSF